MTGNVQVDESEVGGKKQKNKVEVLIVKGKSLCC
jgi:hypothetical protein